ncbi:MAG: hypothetical protein IH913_14100 [Proteobacteria bacterium]|nr:hypothetical protein [Pseudomonadota bacterium]
MTVPIRKILIPAVTIFAFIWGATAQAVPSFARKHELNCSACHTAYPQLNATGRDFKENGYRFLTAEEATDMLEVSDFLQLEKHVPMSAILVARPYDKKDSGVRKVRALHEVELIVAGTLSENWSGYFEIEAEDETGFELELAPAVLTYNHSKALNVQFVYGPTFWADPYGILGDHFRLTRGHVGAIDQKFGMADAGGRFRAVRQNVGIFGRVADRFFYNVNFSGKAADAEGEDASVVSGLFNVDITDDIMVGVFTMNGDDKDTNRDFGRTGVQFQADLIDLRIQGLFIAATDDRDAADPRGPGEDDNNAFSVQSFYTFRDDTLRPTWVPLLRYDTYETNDGVDSFGELTFNIGYYFNQNIKGYLEYWNRFDAPTAAQEDSRITLQIVAAF